MAGLTTGRNDGRLPARCLGSGTHILSTQQRRMRVMSLPLDMGSLRKARGPPYLVGTETRPIPYDGSGPAAFDSARPRVPSHA